MIMRRRDLLRKCSCYIKSHARPPHRVAVFLGLGFGVLVDSDLKLWKG